MAWSGLCGDCGSGVIVYPTDDQAADVQKQVSETWPEMFADCPIEDCNGTIDWNGNDPIARVLVPRML